jgi:hypothetical protein
VINQWIPKRQWWQSIFFSEVHLLAGKLVPVVMIRSLRGSRANRHHTPNPQSGAAQPTQDEDPQAMRNPLELSLALHRGRHKNPLQSQWSEPETITSPRSMIHQSLDRLGVSKHTKRTRSPLAQIAQLVPQDARTLSNALEALQYHSRWWNQVCKWVKWCA